MNTMSFTQSATLLNSIVSQATGKAQITPVNTEQFIAVAKVGLEVGYDPLMTAISQVLSKTIFSIRPYSRKFAGLYADSTKYGNHVRKLQMEDSDWEEDDRIKLVDGQSVDPYIVKKPKVLQTNFYGEEVFQRHITIYRDQLDCAFSSPEEFSRFITMLMQNVSDQIEQAHESVARAAVANFIAGKTKCDSDNVIYLLDLYDDETGETTTAETIKQPENFVPFAKWLSAYLKTTSDLLTERSVKFHKNFTIDGTTHNISRHTPLNKQKLYIYAKELNNIDSTVLSGVFNPDYMKLIDHERVNFWQSIDTPVQIKVKPGYNADDGSIATNSTNTTVDNVLGVIFDEEAIGYTMINEWSAPSGFNPRGGYQNIFYHFTDRYWNDFSENGVVLILDHAPSTT